MWKCKTATLHVKWMKFKREWKDEYLGELRAVVIEDHTGWMCYAGKHDNYRMRDITYRLKRKKLPFPYPKIRKGTQVKDSTALPLGVLSHSVVINWNDQMNEINIKLKQQADQQVAFNCRGV